MAAVPKRIVDYWDQVFEAVDAAPRPVLSCAVSAKLPAKRPAMILELADGPARAVVRPEIAQRIAIQPPADLSVDALKSRLIEAGVTLHDPDHLFYRSGEPQATPAPTAAPRRLSEADRAAFEIFYNSASEQDRDDAWVELDHWAVFGWFDGDRLVSAASLTLWNDSPIADLGVLTLADARGKGFARAVVEAINRYARAQGYEPQYRCQLDNHASVALARSCGLALFGHWTVATDRAEPGDE